MSIGLTRQTVSIFEGIRPYVTQMKEAINSPTNTLGENFDTLFPIFRVVSIIEGSRETEGIILVRGDADRYAGFLVETLRDIRVKEVVEKYLGVKL